MRMIKLATVTIRATHERYDVYSVQGDHGTNYPVWARHGYACRCWCGWKQHHPSGRCKHMLKLQVQLDEQRRTAPLAREPFALVKG